MNKQMEFQTALDTSPRPSGSVSYVVEAKNDLLGDSSRIMTKDQIRKFNLCALSLSDAVDKDGKEHTSGMWTVKPNDLNEPRGK